MRKVAGWQNPDLELGDSEIHGRGLFSKGYMRPGDVILRMGGLIIDKTEFRDDIHCRYSTVSISERSCLTRSLNEPKTLDDFINHSCSPNAWLEGEHAITAKSQIEPGQEVTIDYAVWLDHPGYQPLGPCACGSANCRTWITGEDWRRMDTVRNNYGHFMPYLNKLIQSELDVLNSLRS